MSRGKERLGSGDEEFCFVTVKFEKIAVHPGFYFNEAVCDSGSDSWGNGFCGDIDLGIVGIAVKVKSVVTNDVAKREHVDNEEEGTKH